MARAGLRWTINELAAAASVSRGTVILFEGGRRVPRPGTLAALRVVLEAAGVEFIKENGSGPGLRLPKAEA
jgi:transcriptional regulator with XRE-family HTH domain